MPTDKTSIGLKGWVNYDNIRDNRVIIRIGGLNDNRLYPRYGLIWIKVVDWSQQIEESVCVCKGYNVIQY